MTKFDKISFRVASMVGERPILALGLAILGMMVAGGWEIN